MIKEFNTASRLMTPLGCRGTQERSRQGPWRILAETGIGSKIYKFIHQKESLFMSSTCVFAALHVHEDECEVEDGDGGADSPRPAVYFAKMHRIKWHKTKCERGNDATLP